MGDTSLALKVPIDSVAELYRNYATDERLASRAKKIVKQMLDSTRRNRMKYDRLAFRRYNQWALVTDDRYYLGRANAYVPMVRRGVERLVTQAIRETFPNDKWWGVEATDDEFEPNVAGQKALMNTQLQREMKVKRKARPAYRQLVIYGTSPIKVPWKFQKRKEAVIVPDATGQKSVTVRDKTLYDGPDFTPVDYFSFHVYPLTVMDVDDARMVAEDMVVELEELERDKANYANVEQAKNSSGGGSSGSDAFQRRQERLQQLGITEDELRDANYAMLTECYVEFDFKDRFKLGPEPAIVTLAWENVVVRLQRNAYGRPPYFVMKDAEMVNEFMAHARTEATDRLQIILNDVENQNLDAATFANNPVVVVDPNYVEDYHSIAIFPGAKIPAPKDAVTFDRPPEAAFSQKERGAWLYNLGLENLGSPAGASPSPAASGTPRGARTFGGMQMMQMLAGSEVKELVEFQEDAVWEPMLRWVAFLNATFLEDERTLKLAGQKGAPLLVSRETFKGDYAYNWLGTATMQNRLVGSAQMLVAMNIASKMNPATTGGQVPNMAFMFEKWWDAQGLPGSEHVFLNKPKPSVDPHVENQLVMVGRAIEVSPQDNDPEHIADHSNFRASLHPESREYADILRHEQAHYHSFLMKQQAMLMAQQPPAPPPPKPASVILKGNLSQGETARFAGAGSEPNGARAGTTPTMGAQTGMGPSRAMAGAPVGAM